MRFPRVQAISVQVSNSPTVQGRARPIRTETGVGKEDSEGPKSAERMRCQYVKYCSISGPPVPYSSRRATRIMATASGLLCPMAVIPAIIWSTGSIGVRCVMKKVSEMPMKTTRMNCAKRFRT